LGERELARIFVEPEQSIFRTSRAYFERYGIDLQITRGALIAIAWDAARQKRLGARALRETFRRVIRNIEFDPAANAGVLTIEKVKESMTPDLPIDRAAIDGLEEGLLGADVGAELTTAIVDRLEQRIRGENIRDMDRLTAVLREETRSLIPQRKSATIDVARA